MERFSEFLRKHAMEIISFKKKNNKVTKKRAAGIIYNLLYF